MHTMFYLWLIVAGLFLILELGSPGLFYFLAFACGAALSGLLSMYVPSVIVQCLAFLVASIVALFILKVFVHREHATKKTHTNMYALQGKRGFVVVAIEPNTIGQVKVGGEQWAARSLNNSTIEIAVEVEIVQVSGAHAVVKKVS